MSQQTVTCQNGKKFVVPYVVYEKVFDCASYPPDQVVTFTDIKIECDGLECTKAVTWAANVVDANCEMTAHVDKVNVKDIRGRDIRGRDIRGRDIRGRDIMGGLGFFY